MNNPPTGRFLRSGRVFWICSMVCLGSSIYYSLAYRIENQYLEKQVLSRLLNGNESPQEKLKLITLYVHTKRDFETTERIRYINPLFRFVKATPRHVDELGGHCGNLARLTISLLHLSGIQARKVHLYSEASLLGPRKTAYVHAVVEAWIEDRWAVTDPAMGLIFHRIDGSPATVNDLSDASFLSSQVGSDYDMGLFAYGEVRHIRWDKFTLGETFYNLVKNLFGKSFADSISYPYWAERPYLVFSGMFFGLTCCFAVVACLSKCGKQRNIDRISEQSPPVQYAHDSV